MERLTTDHPQSNTENALNLFYGKDGEVWVRGGGPAPEYPDVSLYEFIRKIILEHNADIETDLSNEDLADELYERLFDGPETIEGLIATLYTAAWAFAELRERLKRYEGSEDG